LFLKTAKQPVKNVGSNFTVAKSKLFFFSALAPPTRARAEGVGTPKNSIP